MAFSANVLRLLATMCVLVGLAVTSEAQQVWRISGRVVDGATEEPVPFSNVYIKGGVVGITTDFDGYYALELSSPLSDTLVVSALGYETIKVYVRSDSSLVTRNFSLQPSQLLLGEVQIFAGENPANAIVRNIVRHKRDNDLLQREVVQAVCYEKVELDFTDLPPGLQRLRAMKDLSFVFEQVDSTSDAAPYLPLYLSETLSDFYYMRSALDNKPRWVPKARKISGAINPSAARVIGEFQDAINLYDNWLVIFDRQFISPFANNALAYYEYYIQDSTFVQDRWCYKLKFKPRRKQETTFYGDFWVDMGNYAIVLANLRMSPEVNINLVSRIILYYEATFLGADLGWLPSKEKMVMDFKVAEKAPGMIGRRTLAYRDYSFQPAITMRQYQRYQSTDTDPTTLLQTEQYWASERPEALTEQEAGIYQMLDSVRNTRTYRRLGELTYLLSTGNKVLGKIEVGSLWRLYSFNAQEGHRMSVGLGTSNNFSKRIWLWGYVAYGTSDRRWKYGGQMQLNLTRHPRSIVGASHYNDVALFHQNSENFVPPGLLTGFYRRPVPIKLFSARETKVFYERSWNRDWKTRASIVHQQLEPVNGLGLRFLPVNDLRLDTNTVTTELSVRVQYTYKEQWVDGQFWRTSLGTKYPVPVVGITYTAGVPGILGSRYAYQRVAVNVSHWFPTGILGWSKYIVEAGRIFGNVPFWLCYVFPGNESYSYSSRMLNTMNRYEFAADTYVTLFYEHHWNGVVLNYIPLMRKLRWREVSTFRAAMGSLGADNARSAVLQRVDAAQMVPLRDLRRPFMEVGFGIENIFKFLRVDVMRRLNYFDNPEAPRWVVYGTLQFYL